MKFSGFKLFPLFCIPRRGSNLRNIQNYMKNRNTLYLSHAYTKKARTWDSRELSQLLSSDTDDWDQGPMKVMNSQLPKDEINDRSTGSSDEDDDIILFFQENKKHDIMHKRGLKGAVDDLRSNINLVPHSLSNAEIQNSHITQSTQIPPPVTHSRSKAQGHMACPTVNNSGSMKSNVLPLLTKHGAIQVRSNTKHLNSMIEGDNKAKMSRSETLHQPVYVKRERALGLATLDDSQFTQGEIASKVKEELTIGVKEEPLVHSFEELPVSNNNVREDYHDINQIASPAVTQEFNIPSSNDINALQRSLEITEDRRPAVRNKNHELVFLTQKTNNINNMSKEESEEPAKKDANYLYKKLVQGLVLSEEQESVIELAKQGYNIFYTGSAGTGKSVLLRVLIKTLRRKYGEGSVAVTASTGLAACNIGGITVHSFAGIGLGNADEKKLLKKVKRSKKHVQRWQSISALVIDEVSMIEGELLDKLDYIGRNLRKDQSPFGGIQIVLSGDFFQLPPVNKRQDQATRFAFDSNAWKEAIDATIMLQKVFRQQGDSKFIKMLNEMRVGNINSDTELEFQKLARPLPADDIIPAELYSTRNEVERANNSRLNSLPGRSRLYQAIDGGDMRDEEAKEKLLANFLAPRELNLKVGAQVMMIKNIDETLVNGSLGKVIDFIDQNTFMFYEKVRNDPSISEEEMDMIRQGRVLPDQGSEGDDETNQKIIRKKTLKESFCKLGHPDPEERLSESIFDFLKVGVDTKDPEILRNIERKKQLLNDLHQNSNARKLPLVRFLTPDGSSRCVLVQPEDWAIEDENEKPLVSRVQLPLMLAWALSIHKSQGQTLPKVKVDLRRIFEKGQAYVALSRAVSRDGLQVLNFSRHKVQAHETVVEFYKTLTSANDAKKRFNNSKEKQQKLKFAPKPAKNAGRARESRQDRIKDMLLQKNKKKPLIYESTKQANVLPW